MKESEADNPVLLWNSFRNGSDEAYVLIYKKYVQSLYSLGLQFTQNRELIKDCIQEVFTKLYKYRSKLGDTDNIKYYLLASMRNQLLTTISKENIYTGIQPENTNDNELVDKNVEDILIEKEDDQDTTHKINQCMAVLTDRQREAVRYRYIEGLSSEEICTLMDLNYQSLQNILSRSLKKIREHFNSG